MGVLRERFAIDLGTAYTVAAHESTAEFIRESSTLAVHKETDQIVAYGNSAKQMGGRSPEEYDVREFLKDGVISDFSTTQLYLNRLIHNMIRNRYAWNYEIYVCLPWHATDVELQSYREGLAQKRGRIYLVREPFAAALGSGLDVSSNKPISVLDMGGGSAEIATIQGGYVVHANSLRMAGNHCDLILQRNLQDLYDLEIGRWSAEKMKVEHGSIWPIEKDYIVTVTGAHRKSQQPKNLEVSTKELRSFLEAYALKVERLIKDHIKVLPGECHEEVKKHGLMLAGGSSLLRGWKSRLEARLNMPIGISDHPELAVIRGMKTIVSSPSQYRQILRISEAVSGD